MTSTIARHGAPEAHMVDESLPGIRYLSRTRVKRKGLTEASSVGENVPGKSSVCQER